MPSKRGNLESCCCPGRCRRQQFKPLHTLAVMMFENVSALRYAFFTASFFAMSVIALPEEYL
jgi:hypothetical protein